MKKLLALLPLVLTACYPGRWAEAERVVIEVPPRSVIVRYVQVEPKVYDVWARMGATTFIYDPVLDRKVFEKGADEVIGRLCKDFSREVSQVDAAGLYARYTCA